MNPVDDKRSGVPLDYRPPSRKPRQWRLTIIAVTSTLIFLGLFLFVLKPLCSLARSGPYQVSCGANLRQIGQALLLYADAHAGQFPAHLEDLVLTEALSADDFVCPATDDSKATGPTTQAIIEQMRQPGHMSYIYCGRGLSVSSSPETIVAYEPLTNHNGDGMTVLYADGHTEFVNKREALGIIDQIKTGHNPPSTTESK